MKNFFRKFSNKENFYSYQNYPFYLLIIFLIGFRNFFPLIPYINNNVGLQGTIQDLFNFTALVLIFEHVRKKVKLSRSETISVFPYRALSHTANDVSRKLVSFVNGVNLEELGVIEADSDRWKWIRAQINHSRKPETVDGQGWWTKFMEPRNMARETQTLLELLEEKEYVNHLFIVVTRMRREINAAFGTWAIYTEISEELEQYLKLYRHMAKYLEELQSHLRLLKQHYEENLNIDKTEEKTQSINAYWVVSTISLVIAHKFSNLAKYETSQIERSSESITVKMSSNASDVKDALLWAFIFKTTKLASGKFQRQGINFALSLNSHKDKDIPVKAFEESFETSMTDALTDSQFMYFEDKEWLKKFNERA